VSNVHNTLQKLPEQSAETPVIVINRNTVTVPTNKALCCSILVFVVLLLIGGTHSFFCTFQNKTKDTVCAVCIVGQTFCTIATHSQLQRMADLTHIAKAFDAVRDFKEEANWYVWRFCQVQSTHKRTFVTGAW
jgi:hypothetical protein